MIDAPLPSPILATVYPGEPLTDAAHRAELTDMQHRFAQYAERLRDGTLRRSTLRKADALAWALARLSGDGT